jgi:SPP1 gp7 family putative phage head morphogenesis protein
MTWGPLKADGRMAAKSALKIRAALAQTAEFKLVYESYLRTQPNVSDNRAQDRARARAWVMLNVRVNMMALMGVLERVYAEGWVTGEAGADEALIKAREIKKAADDLIDWSKWQPGDEAAALLIRPTKAFERFLGSFGVTLKDLTNTTVNDIGNSIADALEQGLSANQAAKLIKRNVASSSRALTIAITEQNRAMSAATINRYKEMQIPEMEWEVSDPCPKCAQNANQVVQIGGTFNSGNTQPPAHPNCRCALLPVIPDFDEMGVSGSIGEGPTLGVETSDLIDETNLYAPRSFKKGADEDIYSMMKEEQGAYIEKLSKEQLKAVAGYQAEGTYDEINNFLRGKGQISPENKKLMKTLDKVIEDSGFNYNLKVYRGISDDTGAFTNLKIGDTILEKGYSSTSPNPAVAEAFANSTVIEGKPVVLEIDLPFGQPALASDVASNRLFGYDMVEEDEMMIDITGFTRLNEVTLPRDITLEVTEIIDKENARYVRTRIKQ